MIVLGNRLCASVIYQIIVYLYCTLYSKILYRLKEKKCDVYPAELGPSCFSFLRILLFSLIFYRTFIFVPIYIIKYILCLPEFRFHNILDYIKICYNLSLYYDLRKRCTDASLGKFIRG